VETIVSTDAVRSTIYVDAALHRALRLKAATLHRSMSELVNDAIRAALREDDEILAEEAERVSSPSHDALLAQLKAELQPSISKRTTAGALLARWRSLPSVDPVQFRADVDSIADSSL
jgi:Arc/MetJ-type ribon-helix-helix transcriptional regulator